MLLLSLLADIVRIADLLAAEQVQAGESASEYNSTGAVRLRKMPIWRVHLDPWILVVVDHSASHRN